MGFAKIDAGIPLKVRSSDDHSSIIDSKLRVAYIRREEGGLVKNKIDLWQFSPQKPKHVQNAYTIDSIALRPTHIELSELPRHLVTQEYPLQTSPGKAATLTFEDLERLKRYVSEPRDMYADKTEELRKRAFEVFLGTGFNTENDALKDFLMEFSTKRANLDLGFFELPYTPTVKPVPKVSPWNYSISDPETDDELREKKMIVSLKRFWSQNRGRQTVLELISEDDKSLRMYEVKHMHTGTSNIVLEPNTNIFKREKRPRSEGLKYDFSQYEVELLFERFTELSFRESRVNGARYKH